MYIWITFVSSASSAASSGPVMEFKVYRALCFPVEVYGSTLHALSGMLYSRRDLFELVVLV